MPRWLFALVLLAAASPLSAANSCGSNGVAVQVLGSGGPEFNGDRAGSSVLVWIDGQARLLIDTGSGAALRFAKSGAKFSDLDAVLFTHLHAAHTVDFPAFVQASASEHRTQPLPVYGPPSGRGMPSTIGFIRDLLDSTRGTYRHLGEFIAPLDKSSYKIEPHDVRDPPSKLGAPRRPATAAMSVFRNARLQVQAVSVAHDRVPAIAYRIDVGEKSVLIAGDGDSAGLIPLARQVGLLLAHHAIPETGAGVPHDGYLPPSRLGEIAQASDARQLVLVHRLRATLGREEESLAAIRRHFKGPVEFADDLACYRP